MGERAAGGRNFDSLPPDLQPNDQRENLPVFPYGILFLAGKSGVLPGWLERFARRSYAYQDCAAERHDDPKVLVPYASAQPKLWLAKTTETELLSAQVVSPLRGFPLVTRRSLWRIFHPILSVRAESIGRRRHCVIVTAYWLSPTAPFLTRQKWGKERLGEGISIPFHLRPKSRPSGGWPPKSRLRA